MRRAVIVIACACGSARPQIAPPSAIPVDDVVVRLDQQLVPRLTVWSEKPRWQYIRDYDAYEPRGATETTPLAILIHDAGGHRRELGPLARHLARHGVRVIVPAVDHDDPDDYGPGDGIRMHQIHAQPEGPKQTTPMVLIGHGAGAYLAARLSVQNEPRLVGAVLLAPATPPRYDGRSTLFAGDVVKHQVQLDVEHASGRCTATAADIAFRMTRNHRTRALLAGTSYCNILGEASCAARCGGTYDPAASAAAFEAVARVVAAWTSTSRVADADLLAATATTKAINHSPGDTGSDGWNMPSVFWELGGAMRDDTVQHTRGALGVRLDLHSWPSWSGRRVPAFERRPSLLSPRRWGLGGYGEIAWQHDELERDDLRIGGGFAFATERGTSHVALGLGVNLLLGQHGADIGADATLHFSEWLALRFGATLEDRLPVYGTVMVTIPSGVVAILIPFML